MIVCIYFSFIAIPIILLHRLFHNWKTGAPLRVVVSVKCASDSNWGMRWIKVSINFLFFWLLFAHYAVSCSVNENSIMLHRWFRPGWTGSQLTVAVTGTWSWQLTANVEHFGVALIFVRSPVFLYWIFIDTETVILLHRWFRHWWIGAPLTVLVTVNIQLTVL